MKFDYSKLLGRIKEKGMTQDDFAEAIGVSRTALFNRMKGNVEFTASDIVRALQVLDLTPDEIPKYFFAMKV